MRLRTLALFIGTVLVLGSASVAAVLLHRAPAGSDTAELNDLRARTAESWPQINAATFPGTAPPLTVIDMRDTILYSTAPELRSELSAAQLNAHVMTIRGNGDGNNADTGVVGILLVASTREAALEAQQRTTLAVTIAVLVIVALLLVCALFWLWMRILRPFKRLQEFAGEIAGGNLDSPLPMDRANAFGAFSESFDLMRSELRRAHETEQSMRQKNREVLAQIGHDIRTPVAVIAAASDVLLLSEADPERATRLETISLRAEQIARLLDDLISTNANELAALTVISKPYTSIALSDLIRECDTKGAERVLAPFTLPDCIVEYDPERMRQVIDNLLSNSRKFAGTTVTITAVIEGAGAAVATTAQTAPTQFGAGSAGVSGVPRLLQLEISDTGPGVSAQDRQVILAQGVRGSNATGTPGSGLGLFIAARLIERMGGELSLAAPELPHGSGFTVLITLPLSGDDSEPQVR